MTKTQLQPIDFIGTGFRQGGFCRDSLNPGKLGPDAAHPNGDIAIEITGLRPGEKLYEELLIGDNPEPTDHPRIMKAHEDFMPWPLLEARLTELQAALRSNDVAAMKQQLAILVHGYQPAEGISDWVHLERDRRRSFR